MSASATINIDIGGTFTDAYVVLGDKRGQGKAPTSRHHLATGFMDSITRAAEELELSFEDLIGQVDVIRYATTISLNTLIQRTGPRLGFITTAGFEHVTYMGRARQWVDGRKTDEVRAKALVEKPAPLVPPDMIIGVHERIDKHGNVLQPLDDGEAHEAIQRLVDQGAEAFVIGLMFSHRNPMHEQRIGALIDAQYPETYLGSVPVILSSDVTPTLNEYPRWNTAILTAYLQRELADELGGLGDSLRDAGYGGPLLAVHAGGGAASIARTSPVNTFNSGPVAGLFGGAAFSAAYDADFVALTDMGGTSFDLAVLEGGRPRYYEERPIIDRWLVKAPTLQVQSIGAGGGSIVSIAEHSERLEVGPRSAGSNPGPICYNLGGTEPTVTDADVVLGLVRPTFLGGRLELERDLALEAFDELGDRIGMTGVELAHSVRRIIDGRMGNEIYKELTLKGINPARTAIVANGGAGPLHACGFAKALAPRAVYVLPQSPVFCAFGAAEMDVSQVYVRALQHVLMDGDGTIRPDSVDALRSVIDEMKEQALRDFEGEGFRAEEVEFALSLEMQYGGQIFTVLTECPLVDVRGVDDVRAIVGAFEDRYAALYSRMSAFPAGGVECGTVQLDARRSMPKAGLARYDGSGQAEPGGERAICWDGTTFTPTPVYDADTLTPGTRLSGPAVVDATYTTTVVEAGWELAVDSYGTFRLSTEESR